MINLVGNTNYVAVKNLNNEEVPVRTNLSAVDFIKGNNIGASGDTLYVKEATAADIIYGTTASGVVSPSGLKAAMDEGFLAFPEIATVDEILSGSTGQMVDPNGLNSALKVAQAVDVSTLGATTMDGDVSVLNYLDTFTLVGTWDSTQDPNVWVTNKYGFGINGTGNEDPTKYPKYAAGLRYIFLMDIKLVSGQFASILAMNNGRRQDLLIDGGSLSDYNWHRYAFEFDSNAAYFIINITKNSSVQLKNVRQYEVTALTDDAIKALAGFEDPDDFEYSHIIDQNMINPWLQIIDMGSSPEVLVYPGLSYKINAQNNNVKLSVPSIPANKSGLDSYVELYVGGEGSVAVQRPLVLGSTITPYSTNQCTVKFRDGRAVLTIDEVSQDYVVTVTSGVEGTALEGSLYYGLVYATANQIAFNSGLDGEVISLPDGTEMSGIRQVRIMGNGQAQTIIGNCSAAIGSTSDAMNVTLENLTLSGFTYTTNCIWLYAGNLDGCCITNNNVSSHRTGKTLCIISGGSVTNCLVTGNTISGGDTTDIWGTFAFIAGGNVATNVTGTTITNNSFRYSMRFDGSAIDTVSASILDLPIYINGPAVHISGSDLDGVTFFPNNINSKAFFVSDNIVTGQISGPGTTTLTATSVLDLSHNLHAAVASGGTVTAAAGAEIIAYGGNTVTISANTSGSYLLNNGTITNDVYLVTVSGSSTGSGSLIYGMTASSAGNILFDSGVDGSTITLPSGSTASRNMSIIGNKPENTIISSGSLFVATTDLNLSNLTIKDCSIGNTIWSGKYINISNSVLDGVSGISGTRVILEPRRLTDCQINNCTVNVDYACWLSPGVITRCSFSNNAGSYSETLIMSVGGSTIEDCIFSNNRVTTIINGYRETTVVKGNTFSENYRAEAPTVPAVAVWASIGEYSPTVICIDNILNGRLITGGGSGRLSTMVFSGINKLVGNCWCEGTGKLNLVADSTLDLTSNSNSVVVYGASPSSASITGTTINVVASTASDAAIGGTATVLYNDNGVTKSRTLTGGGAGYIMRNNGAWGVPVTASSGTGTGSLYDLLVNGTATDITFASVVDGTVTLSDNVTVTRSVNINGAGVNTTTLSNGYFGQSSVNYTISIADLTFSGYSYAGKQIYTNVKFANGTSRANSDYGNQTFYYIAGRAGTGVTISNCIFTDTGASVNGRLIFCNANSSVILENTTISGNTCNAPLLQFGGTQLYPVYLRITGCTFSNNVGNANGVLYTGYLSDSSYIANSVFDTDQNIVIPSSSLTFYGTNILNSTVSGAGTVVFADGATVTSTAVNGGTIAVLSQLSSTASAQNQALIENITITGVTAGVILGGNIHLKNCIVKNTNSSGQSGGWKYVCAPGSSIVITLEDVIVEAPPSNISHDIYAYQGRLELKGTTIGGIANIYTGELIFDGSNSLYYINPIGTETNGRVILVPGSTTTFAQQNITSVSLTGDRKFYVGTRNTDGTVDVAGTATVIFAGNSTTVSVSGSGSTIDSTGLHS